MTPRRHTKSRWAQSAAIGLIALISLSGCAALGGNVRGDFSCAAPDGICAPSSTIDDRAIALISGDEASEERVPASGSDRRAMPRGNRAEAGRARRLASGDAARTQERVLRIIFQPYIDDRGRLHEASAVHAVVARGEWQQQALNDAMVRPALIARSSSGAGETLADAVDRIDPPAGAFAAADLDAPDPAVVAAARARGVDPVAAIKADVAARLAPKPTGARGPSREAPATGVASQRSGSSAGPAAGKGAALAPARATTTGAAKPIVLPKASSGQQAVDRVKADPAYRAAAENAATQARSAAVAEAGQPGAPAPTATVKAAGFPAAVSRED